MNKEDNKNNVQKNTIILLLCVIVFTIILVSVIIVFSVGDETTPTYSKVNNTNTNITTNNTNTNNSNNNVSKQLASYIIKSSNGLRGAEFSFDLDEFVKKYNSYMDKEFNGQFKMDLSDFKDVTVDASQNQTNSKLVKRYYCELPSYNVYSSEAYAIYVDYYSNNHIGAIVFLTNSSDIAAGGVVSRIFQAIFNMPKDTITTIKSNNEKGNYKGYSSDYCLSWETKLNRTTFFEIIPYID